MSDIRDALHASLDEAEAELIRSHDRSCQQQCGLVWPALRLLVEAIRQRDHEIERRLNEIERRLAAQQPKMDAKLSGHDLSITGAYDE